MREANWKLNRAGELFDMSNAPFEEKLTTIDDKTKAIKAIYISGNSDPETRKRAEATNMLDFCVKPLSFEELEVILGKIN